MTAYYNEHDPNAAVWLRELIKAGLIAKGEVDERSIEDVTPNDLRGFTQCHFFAGIGVWSYALRLAGWPDSKPVWTGSCPCQPFSAAGKGKGFADERHLWPAWHWLIEQCKPHVVFGEQVASRDGLTWFDLVSTDLEGSGYTCGAVNLPACGVGAPHIRQRMWFVADPLSTRRAERWAEPRNGQLAGSGGFGELGDSECTGSRWNARAVPSAEGASSGEWKQNGCGANKFELASATELMGYPHRQGRQGRQGERGDDGAELASVERAGGAVRGFWSNAEWIYCRDGKYRPVEPGTFPLAHGAPARVGRLRGYGNAINAQAAAEVISAYMEARR